MKVLVLSLCLLIIGPHFAYAKRAKKSVTKTVDVIYRSSKRSVKHRFIIMKQAHSQKAGLVFYKNGKKHSKRISSQLALAFESRAANIVWDSLLRKPAGKSKCSEFVLIKSGGTSSRICKEDKRNTGKALGLLNAFYKIFK